MMLIFASTTLALIKMKLKGLVSTSPGILGRYIQQKKRVSSKMKKQVS